ncbi:MAG: dihydrodipicolinate synthase family protein [Phycisphaerae bacterium]|nr:dihydrodipicolinate synthase family protein [Phycisphaerae bacterium]
MKNIKDKMTGGVIVPIVSPVDENENIDEKALRVLIQHCISAGVDGVFAGGSAGMGPLLSDFTWQRLMEIVADEVDGKINILGGIITTSTAKAIKKIKIIEQLRFDAMVVTPTFYIAIHSEKEMMAHFNACRQATAMQMVAYNIPGCTGSVVPAEVIEKLATEKSISLVKESSGDSDYFKKILQICKKHDVGLMQGNEIDFDWGLLSGAAGIVPVCANYDPALFVRMYRAGVEQNPEKASALQKEISQLRLNLGAHKKNWISGIMYGMKTLGIGSGVPLMPLQQLSNTEKVIIDGLSIQQSRVIEVPANMKNKSYDAMK